MEHKKPLPHVAGRSRSLDLACTFLDLLDSQSLQGCMNVPGWLLVADDGSLVQGHSWRRAP